MRSVQLPLLLLCLSLRVDCLRRGQPLPEGGNDVEKKPLADNMRKAESLILQSVLKKSGEEKINKESNAPLPEWLSKRQHPGKRYLSNLEKRQHPGKREEEGNLDNYLELEKRQHPGRRSLWDQHADIPSAQLTYLSELSKRQHPGKRYLTYKLQHPGSRGWNDERDLKDEHAEKRQHPGKRYSGTESPDYTAPCDFQEFSSCNEGSLLLDLVENVSRVEEKR